MGQQTVQEKLHTACGHGTRSQSTRAHSVCALALAAACCLTSACSLTFSLAHMAVARLRPVTMPSAAPRSTGVPFSALTSLTISWVATSTGSTSGGTFVVPAILAIALSVFDAAAQAAYKVEVADAAGDGTTANDVVLDISGSESPILITATIRTSDLSAAQGLGDNIGTAAADSATSGTFMSYTTAGATSPGLTDGGVSDFSVNVIGDSVSDVQASLPAALAAAIKEKVGLTVPTTRIGIVGTDPVGSGSRAMLIDVSIRVPSPSDAQLVSQALTPVFASAASSANCSVSQIGRASCRERV